MRQKKTFDDANKILLPYIVFRGDQFVFRRPLHAGNAVENV